jgi:large subunit ribosomal protein L3
MPKKIQSQKKIIQEYRVDKINDFKEGNEFGLEIFKDKKIYRC